jgi:hypothetical protein
MAKARYTHLPRRTDLPTLSVWALRKPGLINPSMSSAEIEVGGLKRRVGLWHMHFPSGGSWSYFLCPHCGRKCQKLRLYDGRLTCRLCDGLGRDRGKDIESIRAKLATPGHPQRKSLEASLRRAIIAQRREKLKGWPPPPPQT